jgi:hypothetical protein
MAHLKKTLSLLLTLTIVVGLAIGFVSTASAEGENGTYSMFMRSTYIDWIKELKWYDVAEQRTGIHVDYV